jgi:hypothetical protein
VRIDRASGEPPENGIVLAPPKHGTRIRVLDFPPDERMKNVSPEQARAAFTEIGAADASSHYAVQSLRAFMHRTETVDYGIVLEGEIMLILDESEALARAGGHRHPARHESRLGQSLGAQLSDCVHPDRR